MNVVVRGSAARCVERLRLSEKELDAPREATPRDSEIGGIASNSKG